MRSDIDWVITSSLGLFRYFEESNRSNFKPEFQNDLKVILSEMSNCRIEIEQNLL